MIKNPPASAGDAGDVGSIPELGRSLEWESALHSSILAWKIPQREEPSELQSKYRGNNSEGRHDKNTYF